MENRHVNLHCHTALCKHAEGTVRDYCRKAVEQGLKILGFAEHSPFPDNRYGNTRMDLRKWAPVCLKWKGTLAVMHCSRMPSTQA